MGTARKRPAQPHDRQSLTRASKAACTPCSSNVRESGGGDHQNGVRAKNSQDDGSSEESELEETGEEECSEEEGGLEAEGRKWAIELTIEC